MAITEQELEAAELDYLNKRLARTNAENDYGLAYEKLLAMRRQFLTDKQGGFDD